ncbi:MAG: hypothetical protein ABSG03_30115 [Bryobacteraceae bacterium]
MAGIELQQRCWNHDAREAACRCPGCGRSYCRECVSEHEGRLLCAACLSVVTSGREPGGGRVGNLAPAAMIAAAILLAWLTYWVAGESVMAVIRRMQQEPNSGAGASVWQPNTALAGVGQRNVEMPIRSIAPQASVHTSVNAARMCPEGTQCATGSSGLVYTDSAGESACPTLALTLVCRA